MLVHFDVDEAEILREGDGDRNGLEIGVRD